MRLHIKNLGSIESADIELKDITIISGPNSSNKTWLSYAIYHYLSYNKLGRVIPKARLNELGLFGDIKSGFVLDVSTPTFRKVATMVLAQLNFGSNKDLHVTFATNKEQFSDFSIQDTSNLFDTTQQRINEVRVTEMIQNLIESECSQRSGSVNFFSESGSPLLNIVIDEGDTGYMDMLEFRVSLFLRNMIIEHTNSFRPFAITSERVGCVAFQKEIDGATVGIKNELENIAQEFEENSDITEKLIQRLYVTGFNQRAKVAIPVRKNLEAVRDFEEESKKESFIKAEHPEVVTGLRNITQGSFKQSNGVLNFHFSDGEVPITSSSSSIKSLFHLELYVNSLAKKGDILLIDEPELNLHPDNQRLMAKVIARIANTGIKVLVTTHSDYFIREINNCIALSNHFGNKQHFMKQYDYIEEDILHPERISAYTVKSKPNSEKRVNIVEQLSVGEFGIEETIFEDIAAKTNLIANTLAYSIDPSLFDEGE